MKVIVLVLMVSIFNSAHSQSGVTLYGYVDSVTFREVEVHPEPIGGQSAWEAFLKKEIRSSRKPGTVIVEFTVNKDDRIPTDIKIYRTDNPDLNNEAVRIIKKSRWVPAAANGITVNYRMRQEIEFK